MRNSFRLSFVILLIFLLSNPVKGEIITTYSINSTTVKKINKLIDQDTIVFVELDDVLTRPQSKIFNYGDNPHRLFLTSMVALANDNSRYLNQIATWYTMRKIRLVEDGWQEFINSLKIRKIPVYGFCTMPIQLQNIEQKRFLELKDLGITFTDKVNDKSVMEIAKKDGWSSKFYYGIIFTGPFTKAQTLLDFMKITNISPKKIIVFDKIDYDLKLIESAFRRFRIDFYSILYWGARQFTEMPDENVVKLQQRMLLDQNKWLEDNEAEAFLKMAPRKDKPE